MKKSKKIAISILVTIGALMVFLVITVCAGLLEYYAPQAFKIVQTIANCILLLAVLSFVGLLTYVCLTERKGGRR